MSVPDNSTNIKRHEGKRHNVTMVTLARKRIKVLFAVMKTVNSTIMATRISSRRRRQPKHTTMNHLTYQREPAPLCLGGCEPRIPAPPWTIIYKHYQIRAHQWPPHRLRHSSPLPSHLQPRHSHPDPDHHPTPHTLK